MKESQTVEFKQIWRDEYLKTICAFANSDGGILYIGLDDNGNIVGLDDIKRLIEILPNKINNRLGLNRDYTNTSNLQIKVYDDKLIMYNGANLSDEVPIEKFTQNHQSKPFNPTIANVFYKAGFIENWGRGTLNIINDCVEYGLPKPTFEYEWTAVKVTLYKDKGDEGINEGIKILHNYIKSNPGQRVSQISKRLQIPEKTLERWIKRLKEEGKIEFKGSKKSGGYYAKD